MVYAYWPYAYWPFAYFPGGGPAFTSYIQPPVGQLFLHAAAACAPVVAAEPAAAAA